MSTVMQNSGCVLATRLPLPLLLYCRVGVSAALGLVCQQKVKVEPDKAHVFMLAVPPYIKSGHRLYQLEEALLKKYTNTNRKSKFSLRHNRQ